jgi:hypothetical protein
MAPPPPLVIEAGGIEVHLGRAELWRDGWVQDG